MMAINGSQKSRYSDVILVLLFVAVIGLLPFGRLTEIPVLILAVWGLVRLVADFKSIIKQSWFKPFTFVFLLYFVLIAVSAIDSYWAEKTWLVGLASWRFYFLGVVILSHPNACYLLHKSLKWMTALLLFWVIDALFQAWLGHDLLGLSSYPGRLTGIFGQNVKLGPVLALFLPLLLMQMNRFHQLVRWVVVLLTLLVIILSGTRSAWLMAVFVLLMFWWQHVQGRRLILMAKVLIISVVGLLILWTVSDDFQDRISRSAQVFDGNVAAIDYALADRLPIWKTAINAYQAHPLNGVGAHAFRKVYTTYADADDVWVQQNGGALHAHHWILEMLAETGTIGFVMMLLLMGMVMKHTWGFIKQPYVWPYATALAAAFLPVVSVYSTFSSFWSICLWWLLIALFLGVKYGQSQRRDHML